MKTWKLAACLVLLCSPVLAASAKKLAPTATVQEMLGDVGVMAKAEDDRCTVTLFEDSVPQGYRLTQYEGCDKAFPVMAKVKAWRVYKDGTMAFTDDAGTDLVTFKKGSGFKRKALKPVDGVVTLQSAQEFAE